MKRYRNNNSMDKPHALTLDMTTAESESLLLRIGYSADTSR